MKKKLFSLILMAASVGMAHASEPVLGIVCSYGGQEAFFPLSDSPQVKYVDKDDVRHAVVMVGGVEKLSVALVDGGTLTVTYDSRSLHDHDFAEEWSKDETNHWHVCSGEGECDAQPEAHSYGDAITAAAFYTCSVCQYTSTVRKAAFDVSANISAIGTFEYTTACKSKIDAARTAYNALTESQQALIPAAQLKVLTDDEAAYDALDDINVIGTVEYTEACKTLIDAARTAYDALTEDQQALITDAQLKVLTDAEAAYADLVAANAVLVKINAIGTVEYTEDCWDLIDAARKAYDALTEAQQALITEAQLKVLTDAEAAYADFEAAAAVVELIYAIDEVEYNDESLLRIETARAAYDALTDAQKAIITEEEYKVLTDAEYAYLCFLKPVFTLDVNKTGVTVNFKGRFLVFGSEFMREMGAFSVDSVSGNWHMHGAETAEKDVKISSYLLDMNDFTFNYADYKLADGEWDITLPTGFFVYLTDEYDFEGTDTDVDTNKNEANVCARFNAAVRRAAMNFENLKAVPEIKLSVIVENGEVSAINSISATSDAETVVYDLAGRKLNARGAKGIVIVNGKDKRKIMVK